MATKKVGRAGRFGPRYGTRTKKAVSAIERLQKQKHSCPQCEKLALCRAASGIWLCKHCGAKMAGGAYLPKTSKRI